MKFLVLLTLFSVSSFAADPFKFEGRFSVDPAKCLVKGDKQFTRAVVRSTNREVLIQLYGEDGAAGLAIPTKNSKELNPNYDYGSPIKYIITKSNCLSRILKSSVIYQYGNRKKETVETYRLEKDGDKLFYREETQDGGLITCELISSSL